MNAKLKYLYFRDILSRMHKKNQEPEKRRNFKQKIKKKAQTERKWMLERDTSLSKRIFRFSFYEM